MSLQTEVLVLPSNSFVIYYPNGSFFGAQPAVLEWTGTQRLRLTTMNRFTELPEQTIFDSSITGIESLTERINGFTLTIDAADHGIGFGSRYAAVLLQLGFIGATLIDSQTSRRTMLQWITAFRVAGIGGPSETAVTLHNAHRRVAPQRLDPYDVHSGLPTAPRLRQQS